MLLPRDPALEESGEQEDPRAELVQRLLEHERFKNAAEMLHEKLLVEENVWSNPQVKNFLDEAGDPELAVTLFDLVKTFQKVLERAKSRPVYQVNGEEVSVPQMIQYLRSRLESIKASETLSLTELLERQPSRRAIVALFLAILEMVRMQAIALSQRAPFGDILIRRHSRYAEVFASDQVLSLIEKDYH